MYDESGEKTWECTLSSYGKVRNFKGEWKGDCPFRYQGQYEDAETGLYYNRFRYYSPDEGMYISQDPIRLRGNNSTLYAYVKDPTSWIDPFGLKTHEHHSDPKFMGGDPDQKTTTLDDSVHIDLHKDMNVFLETQTDSDGNSMRPKRGNSGAVIQSNFSREERLAALTEFYNANKDKYPDAANDFFKQHPDLREKEDENKKEGDC